MIVRMDLFEQPWPEGDFRFFQLGHVVEDVLEAAASWARVFGVGPFHVLPIADQVADYGGEIRTVRIQVAVAQAGPVQIELIQQHCDTPSIYSEWSRGGTSSFHQIATITSDYNAKTAHFASLGYPVAAQSTGGGFRVAYIDTVAAFGFYTEVVEAPTAFLDQVRAISETCADWDGSDPVRIMTRDGYRVPEDSKGHPRTLKS
ncbi:glyoxalase [Mycolicibacterium acapulense]|uniref:Glyoxalase n=2 Tax=Mycobacterium lehmannii TaxID=2048550 RepID=A0A101ADY7_9MYCO|nr:glyoxalase [Mycolicibacterium acapulense]KUI03382.1 glyoxalase [Mycolicibacterium acapulense]KUI14994.1 glyoxalase [Mycolicibacterium acapulense]KUI21266.1 glyoxalase [Mycobacterium lehmannii]